MRCPRLDIINYLSAVKRRRGRRMSVIGLIARSAPRRPISIAFFFAGCIRYCAEMRCMRQYTSNNVVSSQIHWHRDIRLGHWGSTGRAIQSWPHHGIREEPAPPPPQAAEGIVKGQWIMEISRVFFARKRPNGNAEFPIVPTFF